MNLPTLDGKGRIVVPCSIRDAMHLKPGDLVYLEPDLERTLRISKVHIDEGVVWK